MHSSSKTTTRATSGSLPSGGEPNYSFPPACRCIVGEVCSGAIGGKATNLQTLLFHLLEIAGHAAQLTGIHRYAYPCKIPKHSGRIFHGLPLLSSLWYIFYPPRLKIQLFHFLWYVSWLFPLSSEEQIKPPITNSKLQSSLAALLPTLTLIMNSFDFTIASGWGPNGTTSNKYFMDWCGFRSWVLVMWKAGNDSMHARLMHWMHYDMRGSVFKRWMVQA